MKKIYLLVVAFALSLFSFTDSAAQCVRYSVPLFTSVDVTADLNYGSNIDWNGSTTEQLFIDVYEPSGDVETNRPLVIFIHGGSFVGGERTGTDVVPLATDFAKLGYVTASMQYRLGMNLFPPDSVSATEAVIRGYHDAKAAVRYMRKLAIDSGNPFRIDESKIMLVGVSAGGFVTTHYAYLDQISEMPSYVDYTKPGLGGDLEGLSGNAGYSSDITAIVNLCGALRDTAWMQPGDLPILSMHHPDDETVPYGRDVVAPFFGIPILLVNGSMPIHAKADEIGLNNCFHTYTNVGAGNEHVPHVFEAAQYDTTYTYVRNFLYQFSCGGSSVCGYSATVNTQELALDVQFDVYPNPSQGALTVDLSVFESSTVEMQLVDALGRTVWNGKTQGGSTFTFTPDNIAEGLYTLVVQHNGNAYPTKVIFR